MSSHPFKKVKWEHGHNITVQHLNSLEGWIETLVGLSNQTQGTYGLFRNSFTHSYYNDHNNIVFQQFEGNKCKLHIENFQGINRFGQFIKIDGKKVFTLEIKATERIPEIKHLLFVSPLTNQNSGISYFEAPSESPETNAAEIVETELILYEPEYYVSINDDEKSGIPICRFYVKDNHVHKDDNYVPPCFVINSSVMSINAHNNLVRLFDEWLSKSKFYAEKLASTNEQNSAWILANHIYKTGCQIKTWLKSSQSKCSVFFATLESFYSAVIADIEIYNLTNFEENSNKKIKVAIEELQKLDISLENYTGDYSEVFSRAYQGLNLLINLFHEFPSPIEHEGTLRISDVIFNTELLGNRLCIIFQDDIPIPKEKTQLIIELENFSKRHPENKNVRIGIGDENPTELRIYNNLLESIEGKNFRYRIKCPNDIVVKEPYNYLTIYLPRPLGDGLTESEIKTRTSVRTRN